MEAAPKLESQQHLNDLGQWTDDHMMKLNPKKCKNLIFNFTNNHQFSTALHVNNHEVETVKEAKLLGSILTDDLKWSKNTEEIVKSSNKRLRILNEASKTLCAPEGKEGVTLKDFEIHSVIGRGAFGKVFLVTVKGDKSEVFAMKKHAAVFKAPC